MVKGIVVIIAILGTSGVFKGMIKKIVGKIKHKKHERLDPDCWFCKEKRRREKRIRGRRGLRMPAGLTALLNLIGDIGQQLLDSFTYIFGGVFILLIMVHGQIDRY